MAVALEDEKPIALQRDPEGYWEGTVAHARAGMVYRYLLDEDPAQCYPDPASRYQPQGPEGPSEIIDPNTFQWTDLGWRGVSLPGQVIYELHVGTFSEPGTWDGARSKLPQLKELGVTVVELMPVAEFAGDFGWGYDGVCLFAPYSKYGKPDAFRSFVDTAHSLEIAVILDVVYNHFGPSGNHLREFSAHYFSRRETEWGTAINFDGPQSAPVREFICGNASYWVREYHLDGLRLDATQSIFDDSKTHVVTQVGDCVRRAAGERNAIVIAENEPQNSDLLRPVERGGSELDGLWNDDFHHSALAALTGRREAYYHDYLGRAQEFVAAAKYGFLYQGQYYEWQGKRRGLPTEGLPLHAFIAFIENHDQVANGAYGHRSHQQSHPGAHRALTALLLLGPWTPMLFQGQEWATASPFPFFAHHDSELAWLVQKGRREFLAQFPSLASAHTQECVPSPAARETFESAKLDWPKCRTPEGQTAFALHRDLLELRRTDRCLNAVSHGRGRCDGAALSDSVCVLRFWGDDDQRLLIMNLGPEMKFCPSPEPLLAPPRSASWRLLWCTNDVRYGGAGVADGDVEKSGWRIPAYAAMLLSPVVEGHDS